MVQIEESNNEIENDIPSRTYRLTNIIDKYHIDGNYLYVDTVGNYNERIIGYIDDETEAIKQAVYHILNTERYVYDIYDDDYGVELEQYIGADFDYIESTIQQTLEEALTQDDRINGVDIIKLEKNQDKLHIIFNVKTYRNEIEMEVDINV